MPCSPSFWLMLARWLPTVRYMRKQLPPGLDAIHEDFVERIIGFYRADPAAGEMLGASETFR